MCGQGEDIPSHDTIIPLIRAQRKEAPFRMPLDCGISHSLEFRSGGALVMVLILPRFAAATGDRAVTGCLEALDTLTWPTG